MKGITHHSHYHSILLFLLIFLYDDGLGAIPFLLAAIYLCWIIVKK